MMTRTSIAILALFLVIFGGSALRDSEPSHDASQASSVATTVERSDSALDDALGGSCELSEANEADSTPAPKSRPRLMTRCSEPAF